MELPTTARADLRVVSNQAPPLAGHNVVTADAALVEAAEVSAEMSGGGRRVVVVAEVPHEGAVAPLRDVASVHVDTQDGADPDDELAWFATQEIPHLLE